LIILSIEFINEVDYFLRMPSDLLFQFFLAENEFKKFSLPLPVKLVPFPGCILHCKTHRALPRLGLGRLGGHSGFRAEVWYSEIIMG